MAMVMSGLRQARLGSKTQSSDKPEIHIIRKAYSILIILIIFVLLLIILKRKKTV